MAAAIGVRVAWVLAVPTKPVGDFAMYWESAAHLRAHGELDPEFVFMPGYILVLAAIQSLGGGWLAAKLVGAVVGGLGAGVVLGITRRLWDERAAWVASGLYAVWPGGIAVASVTGTDMPSAVAMGAAVWLLLRLAPERPGRAAAAFGAIMGVAAWARAVAVPLAAFSAVHALFARAGWRRALARGVLSTVVAAAVLSPWAVRNHRRYGEWVITDSHGGLTALVGALPNTDGRYSRSLNRMWHQLTGHPWLGEPHRASDRQAYALARQWTAFEPAYALGLVGVKADRLLGRERSLLYWPVYRAGALPDPVRARWDARRSWLELTTDGFWAALVALSLAGLAVAAVRRRWEAVFPLTLQLALTALYAAFFAETRYHLPMALLAFPAAAGALVWGADAMRAALQRRPAPGTGWEAAAAVTAPLVLFGAFFALTALGERTVDRHRWAVHSCQVDGAARLCHWRRADADRERPSPVLGTFDGVGLMVSPGGADVIAAEAVIELPAGPRVVSARVDGFGDHAAPNAAMVRVMVAGEPVLVVPLRAVVAPLASPMGVSAPIEHAGGALRVRFEITGASRAAARVWLAGLQIGQR